MNRGLPAGEWTIFLRSDNGEDLGYQRLPFEAGVAHGVSATLSSSGQVLYEVSFRKGVLHGTSTTWHARGSKKSEAVFKDGALEGPSRYYFEDGKLSSEIFFSNGERNGERRSWHPNGILRTEGSYRDGNRVDTWRYYDSSGGLTKEERFQEGQFVQLLFAVEGELRQLICPEGTALTKDEALEEPLDSRVSCKKTADDGKLIAHGPFIDWIEDVLMGTTGRFVDGERHGTWFFRDRTGRAVRQAEYEHGLPVPNSDAEAP